MRRMPSDAPKFIDFTLSASFPADSSAVHACMVCLTDTYICLSGQFKCTKKQKCIPLNLRCNGQDDCGDGEDETDCRKTAPGLGAT